MKKGREREERGGGKGYGGNKGGGLTLPRAPCMTRPALGVHMGSLEG